MNTIINGGLGIILKTTIIELTERMHKMAKGAKKLKVWFDENGNALSAKDKNNKPLDDDDYHPGESKRIKSHGVLASENWCRWRLVDGVWKCM